MWACVNLSLLIDIGSSGRVAWVDNDAVAESEIHRSKECTRLRIICATSGGIRQIDATKQGQGSCSIEFAHQSLL